MNATHAVSDTSPILAIDPCKYKSVACRLPGVESVAAT